MVKVVFLNNQGKGPTELEVAIQENSTMLEIKKQIHALTSIPLHQIKVMLSGINEMVVIDRRDQSIGISHCGSVNSLAFCLNTKN